MADGRHSFLFVNRYGSNSAPTARLMNDAIAELRRRGHRAESLAGDDSYVGKRRFPGSGSALARALRRITPWFSIYWRLVKLVRRGAFDRYVFLTDPPFLPFVWAVARRRGTSAKAYWWTMDLYPEAVAAAGMLGAGGIPYRALRWLNTVGIARLDGVVALGECQRRRLRQYASWRDDPAFSRVVPPWDVSPELADPGSAPLPAVLDPFRGRKIALYAGNLGRAHLFEPFVAAARALAARGDDSWVFAFVIRGERAPALEAAAAGLPNVVISDYVPEEQRNALLKTADVHLISIAPGWDGIVVPSKLYGVLWTGGPVLYAGPAGADTAAEILRRDLGVVLPADASGEAVVAALATLGERPHRVPPELAADQWKGVASLCDFIAAV